MKAAYFEAYLCSTGVGGGHTAGSWGPLSNGGVGESAGLSVLNVSSVPTMPFTCSCSTTSSCLTWTPIRDGGGGVNDRVGPYFLVDKWFTYNQVGLVSPFAI